MSKEVALYLIHYDIKTGTICVIEQNKEKLLMKEMKKYMKKRTKPAVLRFHKYKQDTNPEAFFYFDLSTF